jgi:hypothetical protein
MEYEFQPIGYSTSYAFYLFNSHMKSGTSTGTPTSDNSRRGIEAGIINTAVDGTAPNGLPANTPVIYLGDYNPTYNTADLGYKGVIDGIGSQSNHGIDPLDPNNVAQTWSGSDSISFETEAPGP